MDTAPLLTLSTEIHLLILAHLTAADKFSFIATCKKLYIEEGLYYEVVQVTINAAAKDSAVFALDVPLQTSRRGLIDAYRPFIFNRPVLYAEDRQIFASIIFPTFFGQENKVKAGDIVIHGSELAVHKPAEAKVRRGLQYGWDSYFRGHVLKMTPSLLRNTWRCPECDGQRSVCPGCGGFSMRWSSCFASCGWSMPCPCCVGLDNALKAKQMYQCNDDEGLYDLWTTLSTELEIDMPDMYDWDSDGNTPPPRSPVLVGKSFDSKPIYTS
ncbi:hypothetical protein CYLTODRAFT_421577 [Cylindrobasidium torrendii FP15055 ss-10]|uniref:F-box domain-containing protein n=1 Tax=Cylindrobasidium torrendii FP15055 ss-10 TaxID=1314674 RepID=A0A0D7BD56_9AGAR|nr:hypothetical protein CYLTODRAFT_421577 [Cylindrobasidium torrendii FP15055 ss-10]